MISKSELPETVAEFAQQLDEKGFRETHREWGGMDSGVIVCRREPLEIGLVKERSQWMLDLSVDGWRETVAFPLLEGFGLPGHTHAHLDPRPSRDPARRYDVPDAVRWLIRQLLSARFNEHGDTQSAPPDSIVFRREPVVVSLTQDRTGWSVDMTVERWPKRDHVRFPRFEGFSNE